MGLAVFVPTQAQVLKNILGTNNSGPVPSNEVLAQNYRTELAELANEKNGPRTLGTAGYKHFVSHLEKRMAQLGLIRYGSVGFRTVYKFPKGRERTFETKFYVNGVSLHIGKDVLPLPFAATAEDATHLMPGENAAFGPWMLPLPHDIGSGEQMHAHLKAIIMNAQERGATAVYFYDNNPKSKLDLGAIKIPHDVVDEDIRIPAWIVSKSAWETHFKPVNSLILVHSIPKYKTTYGEGFNIVGLIDNKASKTVIIMADYDNLFPENNKGTGANANASGVAMMLQLSQILKDPSFRLYNYAFAAFSGSSLGNKGIRSFLSIPGMKSRIAYAIDLTAVGNLSSDNKIHVQGAHTSYAFKAAIRAVSDTFTPVIGAQYPFPASFVQLLEEQVPALSFSTGMEQYKPETDQLHEINYMGMAYTTRFVVAVIQKLNEGVVAPIWAKQPIELKDEDLVKSKTLAARNNTATKSAKQPAANNKSSKSSNSKPSGGKRVSQVKQELSTNARSGNTAVAPTPKRDRPANPAQTTTVSSVIFDTLGLGFNVADSGGHEGALIHEVASNGKASAIGLNAGDVIVQIGSMPVYNSKSYLTTVKKYKEGERAYFKVKKADGQMVMVNVEF